MRKPGSMRGLEDLGRVRLSRNFYLRDFLYSETADFYAIPNIPDNPELAISTGRRLCEELLEPLQATFGRLGIRSGYRSSQVTAHGNSLGLGARVEANAAYHIWDIRDRDGLTGAAACVVIPWFADRYEEGRDWRSLAWWIHDNLGYAHLQFFPKLCAFNIQSHDKKLRRIDSFIEPKGCLTKPGMENHGECHSAWYDGFPEPRDCKSRRGGPSEPGPKTEQECLCGSRDLSVRMEEQETSFGQCVSNTKRGGVRNHFGDECVRRWCPDFHGGRCAMVCLRSSGAVRSMSHHRAPSSVTGWLRAQPMWE